MPKSEKRQISEPTVEAFKERLCNELQRKKDLGIDQKQIALEAGVGQTTISNWKNTKNSVMPSVFELNKLAKVLGVNLEYLCGMTSERDPDTTLEATGLTAQALQNLIVIGHDYSKELLSSVLASKHFEQLVKTLVEINELNNNVSDIAYDINNKSLDFRTRQQSYNLLKELTRSLKYGRYELSENCSQLLNELVPIQETLDITERSFDLFENEEKGLEHDFELDDEKKDKLNKLQDKLFERMKDYGKTPE